VKVPDDGLRALHRRPTSGSDRCATSSGRRRRALHRVGRRRALIAGDLDVGIGRAEWLGERLPEMLDRRLVSTFEAVHSGRLIPEAADLAQAVMEAGDPAISELTESSDATIQGSPAANRFRNEVREWELQDRLTIWLQSSRPS
jgi:hypothetical protein